MIPQDFAAELLADLGESVEPVLGQPGDPGTGDERGEECLIAVVSFSGDHIRGAVGVRLPHAVARVTHPTPDAEHDVHTLADWTAEISNQLLGGLKSRLGRRGYPVWISTPVTLTGVSVQLIGTGIARTLCFDEGQATVWLQISWWEQAPAKAATESLMPGEFALF